MTSFMTTLMSVAFSESFSPLGDGPNFVHNVTEISFCQKLFGGEHTMCFIMFLISVGLFLGFSSPRDITNFVHYETEKLDLFNCCQKQLKSLVSWRLQCLSYSASFKAPYERSKFCPSRVIEISFCQNLLAKDQTRCFMMFSMPVGHSVSLSSLPCVTNSVHDESFKSCIYSEVAGNCSNHFFHDDFDVCGTFCNL